MLHVLSRNFTDETVTTEEFSAAVYKRRVSDWPPRFGDRDDWGSVAVTLSDGGPWLKRNPRTTPVVPATYQHYSRNSKTTLKEKL